MNTFRTIFHMLVVVMIVFIGNVTAKGIFETLTKKIREYFYWRC